MLILSAIHHFIFSHISLCFLQKVHLFLYFTILSQQCPYVTLDIVFLSALPLLGQSCKRFLIVRLWFPHAAFSHVGCWLFLDNKCLQVSLVCLIHILLSLISYYLQLVWPFSHSAMHGLMQYSLLVLVFSFPLPLGISNPLDDIIVPQ